MGHDPVGDGLQQGLDYAETLGIAAATLGWKTSPSGFVRSSPAGCDTMGVSTPPSFERNSARSTPSSCVGRLANTSGSRGTRWRPGTGCVRSGAAIQACSLTGLWDQRLDDGSRMNREVHVRFWESAGLRCSAPLTYLRAYATVAEARASIGRYLGWYNGSRPHSSLDRRTPDQAYFNKTPLLAAA